MERYNLYYRRRGTYRPLSNGYLQYIEKQAIRETLDARVCTKTYRRYVDDSHARFSEIYQANMFLEILNSQDEKIQYTIETEASPGQLAFFDTSIIPIKSI